jgi:hypothetical protein
VAIQKRERPGFAIQFSPEIWFVRYSPPPPDMSLGRHQIVISKFWI